MILYPIRLIWIASQLLAIMSMGDRKPVWPQYGWFAAYLAASLATSVLYWPELIDGWEEAMFPCMIVVLILRTVACLEALHVQTCDFPRWSRMMGGAFLMGFVVVLLLAGVRDNRWSGLFVEYRRYLQIWTGVVCLLVQGMLESVGWWRKREADWHALILVFIALNHALVSWWAMRAHPAGAQWFGIHEASTACDAAAYLVWTFRPARAALFHPQPSSQSPVESVPSR